VSGEGRTPSSLTTTGRVVTSYLPGEANDLLGWARHREVLRRFRRSHGPLTALWLTLATHRHGVALMSAPASTSGSGDPS
jgi:hypothetical protein